MYNKHLNDLHQKSCITCWCWGIGLGWHLYFLHVLWNIAKNILSYLKLKELCFIVLKFVISKEICDISTDTLKWINFLYWKLYNSLEIRPVKKINISKTEKQITYTLEGTILWTDYATSKYHISWQRITV